MIVQKTYTKCGKFEGGKRVCKVDVKCENCGFFIPNMRKATVLRKVGNKLVVRTDEDVILVTAPTTKVVGFYEPSPVLSPCGEALVAQQTPARV
jgi:hypothetical protein